MHQVSDPTAAVCPVFPRPSGAREVGDVVAGLGAGAHDGVHVLLESVRGDWEGLGLPPHDGMTLNHPG